MGNIKEIESMILKSDQLGAFVQGDLGYIKYTVGDIPVIIFKEDIGGSFYYKLPYNKAYDYNKVLEFMKTAIPFISKLIEEERKKKLYGEACIMP